MIGVGAGARTEIDLRQVMGRRARISGSTLRARTLDEKAEAAAAAAAALLPLLAAGRIRVPVEATYELAEVAAAYERFAGGGKLGKIVLTCR